MAGGGRVIVIGLLLTIKKGIRTFNFNHLSPLRGLHNHFFHNNLGGGGEYAVPEVFVI